MKEKSYLLRKATAAVCVLPLIATLGGAPPREAHREMLRIRVSQESSPGAGDFDSHILGFVSALQTQGTAAAFYRFENARYGNAAPTLTVNTSHLFFVNGADGIALFVVQNTANRAEYSGGGSAQMRFDLSGGTASVLLADDSGETSFAAGARFYEHTDWAGSYTDGMVIGTLPAGFSMLGQFLSPPTGLGGGWQVISADGTVIPLQLVPGQRVRLDVHLGVDVQQGQGH